VSKKLSQMSPIFSLRHSRC